MNTFQRLISKLLITPIPLLFTSRLPADTIELKTGEHLAGTFRQANAAGVVIEAAGQAITIPFEKVQAIYFGARKLDTADIGLSQEALNALKGLRSVTLSGVSYREYSTRVLDAKVKVDRYLSSTANDPTPLRTANGGSDARV